MIPMWTQIEIGSPQRYQSLALFPLFMPPSPPVEYLLAEQAIASGTVTVQELGEGLSVSTLVIRNTGTTRVLFLEGEELCGAMQNRVLNTTVMVPPQSTTQVPVSCVEHGRWWRKSDTLSLSGSSIPSRLRRILKQSVTRSSTRCKNHQSDQSAVWAEIDRQQAELDTRSDTAALSDTRKQHARQVADCRQQLPYVDGAVGLAVAIGDVVVSLDLFDQPQTCQKAWSLLLAGLALDVVENLGVESTATTSQVARFQYRLAEAPWCPAPTPGEGQEFRTVADSIVCSALLIDGVLIHASATALV